jgi:hypothetical protein
MLWKFENHKRIPPIDDTHFFVPILTALRKKIYSDF